MTENEYTYPLADENEIFATLPLNELQELIEESRFLNHLYANGIDNWDGYDEARQSYKKEHTDGDSFFSISDPK